MFEKWPERKWIHHKMYVLVIGPPLLGFRAGEFAGSHTAGTRSVAFSVASGRPLENDTRVPHRETACGSRGAGEGGRGVAAAPGFFWRGRGGGRCCTGVLLDMGQVLRQHALQEIALLHLRASIVAGGRNPP